MFQGLLKRISHRLAITAFAWLEVLGLPRGRAGRSSTERSR